MTYSEPAPTAAHRAPSLPSSPFSAVPTMGITVYGCGQDEADLFHERAPRFGVVPTITEAAVSTVNVNLASQNRCISVGHKTHIANPTLLALSRIGVTYISTRSIGFDHIDVPYAERVGITVENVEYSPGSVADYTLMLILMLVRDAQKMIRRVDVDDYRLSDVRGKELRDLTVGVVGTGRIGLAVIARLRGFGCKLLAYDHLPGPSVEYVPMDELLRRSDIVTLHAPLNADTRHLLNRERIDQMKRGAFVINTGRGALVDTDSLISSLESGFLAGAALDVIEGEEGIFYSDRRSRGAGSGRLQRLRGLSNVLISPHIAYYTERALIDTIENSLLNCRKFASGRRYWI